MLLDQFYQCRADNDSVSDLGNGLCLLGRAHAKTNRDGQISGGFQLCDGTFDRRSRRLLLASDTGHGNVIDKPV